MRKLDFRKSIFQIYKETGFETSHLRLTFQINKFSPTPYPRDSVRHITLSVGPPSPATRKRAYLRSLNRV